MVMNLKTLFINYIKLRIKLSKAKIYKIIDNTNDNIYIGSTCKTLKYRLTEHKSAYKRFLKGLHGNTKSFDIIKNGDCKIELLENCDIKTKQELLARERFYIQNNDSLNKNMPGRYDNGTQQYQREYRDTNKDKIIEYEKRYRKANKVKLNDKAKEYRETNKDKIKEYRVNNKDKTNEKFECECGGKYTHSHKSTHFKSTKHQEFIKSNN